MTSPELDFHARLPHDLYDSVGRSRSGSECLVLPSTLDAEAKSLLMPERTDADADAFMPVDKFFMTPPPSPSPTRGLALYEETTVTLQAVFTLPFTPPSPPQRPRKRSQSDVFTTHDESMARLNAMRIARGRLFAREKEEQIEEAFKRTIDFAMPNPFDELDCKPSEKRTSAFVATGAPFTLESLVGNAAEAKLLVKLKRKHAAETAVKAKGNDTVRAEATECYVTKRLQALDVLGPLLWEELEALTRASSCDGI